jgi:hypothetical protein
MTNLKRVSKMKHQEPEALQRRNLDSASDHHSILDVEIHGSSESGYMESKIPPFKGFYCLYLSLA